MGSEILRPNDQEAAATSSTEVDFALVLSRMIDSLKNDPEHLRATVYELARHKLKEQLASESPTDSQQLSKSLEVAIRGVEAFRQKNGDTVAALPRPEAGRQPPPMMVQGPRQDRTAAPVVDAKVSQPAFGRLTGNKNPASRMIWRFAAVFAIVIAVVFALRLKGITVETVRNDVGRYVGSATPAAPKTKAGDTAQAVHPPAAAAEASPEPSPTVPTAFGIYAVSQDKLYELELLPGRAPDLRVAISPAIPTPSRTTLPDGHVKFIVYRRDSATNAADRAEVRVVAKIERETSFDSTGKPVTAKTDASWVMRNIAIPYRTSPKRDNPDMYEVQSEDPQVALSPGRYALVLKGQSYDFSVAGKVTDPRQCLEKLAATNGQFYSACQK